MEVQYHRFITSALDRGEWPTSPTAWVGTRAGLDAAETRNLIPIPRINPRLLGHTARSLVTIQTEPLACETKGTELGGGGSSLRSEKCHQERMDTCLATEGVSHMPKKCLIPRGPVQCRPQKTRSHHLRRTQASCLMPYTSTMKKKAVRSSETSKCFHHIPDVSTCRTQQCANIKPQKFLKI